MTISFETINNINDLKKGDIVFFEGSDWIGDKIRGSQEYDATNKNILDDNNAEYLKYTHVAIYISNGIIYHADFDFWPISRIVSSRVSFEALDIYCKKSKSCLILRNDYIDKSVEYFGLFQLIKEFKDIRKTHNKGYAIFAIIKFACKIIAYKFISSVSKKNYIKNNKVLDKTEYYCSQLILDILKNYGILEYTGTDITPFELIYILITQNKVDKKFIYTLSKEAETKEYKDFVKKFKLYAEIAVIHYNTLDNPNTLNNTNKLNKIIEINTKFNEIISLYKNDAEAYNNWGACLGELKKHKEAIEKYEKAIELNPEHTEAYYNLGSTLYSLGEYKQAIKKFEKALILAKKQNFDENKIQEIEKSIENAKQ